MRLRRAPNGCTWHECSRRHSCARQRNVNGEASAAALAILHPDSSAGALGDLPRDRKTKTGVLAKMIVGSFGIEALEDRLEVFLWDAGAAVLDRDAGATGVRGRHDGYRAAFGAERNRIVDKVAEHLAQPLVACQYARLRRQANVEGDVDRMRRIGH